MTNKKEVLCNMCGVCCTAYSISTLNKPAGVTCSKQLKDGKCGDYENRPQVCRDFKADDFCILISTLSFEEKLYIIKKVYGE